MENQLQKLVSESGLETAKAQYILEKFQSYFEIAADWEEKAKTLVVTNETQIAEMQMARTGRLFLRDKRIAVEKARKKLKEQALREGKAIDGIANVLKALIIPIENYLEQQEKYVEIREAKKAEQKRLEVERRIEEERIAEEKAEAEERERIRLENESLKAEVIEQEKRAKKEREEQAQVLAAQKAKAEAEKRILEEKARKEKEAIEKQAKQEQVVAKARQEQLQAKAEAEKKEKEHLAKLLNRQVECPFCHKKFVPKGKKIDDKCN